MTYPILRYGMEYVDVGQDSYERSYKQRVLRNLNSAKALGVSWCRKPWRRSYMRVYPHSSITSLTKGVRG